LASKIEQRHGRVLGGCWLGNGGSARQWWRTEVAVEKHFTLIATTGKRRGRRNEEK